VVSRRNSTGLSNAVVREGRIPTASS